MPDRQQLDLLTTELRAEFGEAEGEIVPVGQRSDLLPPSERRAVAAAVASWPTAARREATQVKWETLIDRATRDLRTLGLIKVTRGGMPALAADLFPEAQRPAGSFGKNLARWEADGLIRLFHGERAKRYPPLIAVHVPLLTEGLLWLAHHRARRIGTGFGPSTSTARRMAVVWLSQGEVPPPIVESEAWGKAHLLARQGPAGAAFPMTPTSSRRPFRRRETSTGDLSEL